VVVGVQSVASRLLTASSVMSKYTTVGTLPTITTAVSTPTAAIY
jgi:hypothetical protein